MVYLTRDPVAGAFPYDFFIEIDPLLTIAVLVSVHLVVAGLLWTVATIALTIALGRVFCGWGCPLGTTIDLSDRLFFSRRVRPHQDSRRFRRWKYHLLIAVVLVAILGVQVAGWFDPICLAYRTFGTVLFPMLDYFIRAPLSYDTPVTDSIHEYLLRRRVLDEHAMVFQNQIFFGLILAAIIVLLLYHRRFWCRNLCILGAFLGLISRWRKWKVVASDACDSCNRCVNECRMGALRVVQEKAPPTVIDEECIQCFSCVDLCHNGAMRAVWTDSRQADRQLLPGRRGFLRTAAAGLLALPILGRSFASRTEASTLIRPPGSLPEDQFLDACIRCGQCMKVCPTNGLHPATMEAGLSGMWTPTLVPSIGYCLFECKTCGDICPTGAIAQLTMEEKKKYVMGTAFFDTSRCIPYADHYSCIKCEEHCPTPDKSIKFREVEMTEEPNKGATIKVPYVEKELCIGCGICENVCPVSGPAGIFVTRPQKNYLDIKDGGGYS